MQVDNLFKNKLFEQQITAMATKWCIIRNNGAGIKFHPKKQELRRMLREHKLAKEKANNKLSPEYIISNLRKVINFYFETWNIGERDINDVIKYNKERDMRCIICLDMVNSKNSANNVAVCNGPACHIYHSECYLEFLKSEEGKDCDKKYKCEQDTLCIACYQPMYIKC